MLKQRNWWIGAAAAALLILPGLAPPAAAAPASSDEVAEPDIRVQSFSGAFLAARTAEFDNDLAAAVRFYRKALAFAPSNQEVQRNLMLALISTERFDEALPLAEKLKNVPEVERFSRLALAIDAFRSRDYSDAEYWLQLAIESDLDRLVAGVMTAWAKFGQNDVDGAFEKLAGLEGPLWFNLFVDYHRAMIAEQAGRNDVAREAYEAARNNRSGGGSAPDTFWRALQSEVRFLARIGERDAALEALTGGEPVSVLGLELRSLHDEIVAGGGTAPMITTPADGAAEILLNIGSALNRGGGESFVRLYLQYSLALRPNHDATLVQLGHVAEQQSKPEEAIGFYERVRDDSLLKRIAGLQLGLNLADVDRGDEAVTHLSALVAAEPDDMRAYLALGGVYHSRKDFASSSRLYEKALARLGKPEREHWNLFYQLGIAYERLKQWDKAEPNFRKALELEPDQPQVLNYLGYSWVDMNRNLEEGLEMIARAVELRPHDGYIVDSLGWAHYRLGRFEEAVRELERAVSLRPEDPVLNDHLGDAYWRVGRQRQAVFQWTHARDLEPEPDVLAEIERKLTVGLPPLGNDSAATFAMAGEIPSVGEDRTAKPERNYKVVRGQTLWSIAADVLGDSARVSEIIELNPGLATNPNLIHPGQLLLLPPGSD